MALWSKKPPIKEDLPKGPPVAPTAPVPATLVGEAATTAAPAATIVAGNGATPPQPTGATELSMEELAKRRAMSKHISATFGEIVSVLMRQPGSKQHPIGDLEWMVLPALMSNQFSLAEAQSKAQGFTSPIALLMWARVSPEVDQRLSAELDKSIRLAPADWTSGDIVWIVEACGEPRALQAMMRKIAEQKWKGKTVKFRAKGPDGKAVVRALGTTGETAGS